MGWPTRSLAAGVASIAEAAAAALAAAAAAAAALAAAAAAVSAPMVVALAAVAAAAGVSCTYASPFSCELDGQCGPGGSGARCEATGYCSFPDPSCPGDPQRYGAHAGGGLSGRCVDPLGADAAGARDGPHGGSADADPTAGDAASGPDAPAPGCWPWAAGFSFGAPDPIAVANTAGNATDPFLEASGLALHFARRGPDGSLDSYRTTRPDRASPFVGLEDSPFNSGADETRVALGYNGLEAFLASTRDEPAGAGSEIYVARIDGQTGAFGTPSPLGVVNTAAHELSPFPAASGLRLYFVREEPSNLELEIWLAWRPSLDAPWGDPARLPGIVSLGSAASPAVTADERLIVFTTTRPGGPGSHDVWYAKRAYSDGEFAAAAPVPGVNTADSERWVALSADGCELVVSSDRDGTTSAFHLYLARYQAP